MTELRFAVIGIGFLGALSTRRLTRVGPGAQRGAIRSHPRQGGEVGGGVWSAHGVRQRRRTHPPGQPDFVDINTDVNPHRGFVELAAAHQTTVICQKPLAPTLTHATDMLATCQQAGVPLFVHENWRWQRPLRELKTVLDTGRIGRMFRARVTYSNSFPVFENQPFLKELEQFILTDIGTHVLNTTRTLFGEAPTLCCRTAQVHPDSRQNSSDSGHCKAGRGEFL